METWKIQHVAADALAYCTLATALQAALAVWGALALARIIQRVTGPRLPPKAFWYVDLPLPIIGPLLNFYGSMVSLARANPEEPWKTTEKFVKRYGPVLRVPAVFNAGCIVVTQEGTKLGLTTKHQGKKVLGTQVSKGMATLWGRTALPSTTGDYHTKLKRAVHPSMGAKVLAAHVGNVHAACEEWTASVVEPSVGAPIKMYEHVRRLTMEMPLRTLLGLGDAAPGVVARVGQLLVDIWNGTFMSVDLPGTSFHKGRKARRALLPILKTLIKERLDSGLEGRPDTLSEMIRAGLDEEELIDQMVSIMLAGYETTASASCVALSLLPSHPEVLAKLRAEHASIPGPLDWQAFERMTYTQNFMKECLRLKSPVPRFARHITQSFEVDGYTLPAGYAYIYHISAVQRDNCEEPDRLMPERYDDPKCPLNQPYGFTPFAGGEYLCLGERFARLEFSLLMRALVMRYSWAHATADPRIYYSPFFLRFTDDLPLTFSRVPPEVPAADT